MTAKINGLEICQGLNSIAPYGAWAVWRCNHFFHPKGCFKIKHSKSAIIFPNNREISSPQNLTLLFFPSSMVISLWHCENQINVLGCNHPFSQHDRSCFYSPPDVFTWQDGRDECQSLGGDLAMIKTIDKQQDAKEYLDMIWATSDCGSKNSKSIYICKSRLLFMIHYLNVLISLFC